MTNQPIPADLLHTPVRAVNVGLEVFFQSLRAQGVECAHVQWQPPAGGDARLASILDKLKKKG